MSFQAVNKAAGSFRRSHKLATDRRLWITRLGRALPPSSVAIRRSGCREVTRRAISVVLGASAAHGRHPGLPSSCPSRRCKACECSRQGVRVLLFLHACSLPWCTSRDWAWGSSWIAQPPNGDLCRDAPAQPVTQPSRSPASGLNR